MRAFSRPTFYWSITSIRYCHLRKYEISFCLSYPGIYFFQRIMSRFPANRSALRFYAVLQEV